MDKLYQCPYSKATKCTLADACLYCETFGEFLIEEKEKEKNYSMKMNKNNQ